MHIVDEKGPADCGHTTLYVVLRSRKSLLPQLSNLIRKVALGTPFSIRVSFITVSPLYDLFYIQPHITQSLTESPDLPLFRDHE